MNFLTTVLPCAGPLLQAWLAVMLIRRGAHKSFPFFFIYTVFSVIAGITKLLVQADVWKYFFVYWTAEALYAVLGFLAIYEVFRWVFRHFYGLWWFRLLVPAVGTLMLAISLLVGLAAPPVHGPHALAVIFTAEIVVRCLQFGVFGLLILLARFYAVLWQNHAFGIALGFAVSGLGIFLTIVIRSALGTRFVPLIQLIPSVAYIIAVGIWLAAFFRPEPADPFGGAASPLTPRQLIEILRQYTEDIRGLF